MKVKIELISNGEKEESNPYSIDTITERNMNPALKRRAMLIFLDITRIFIYL